MTMLKLKCNRYLKLEKHRFNTSSYDFIWFILGQCLRLILIIVATAILSGGETSVTSVLPPSDNDAGNNKVDHGEEEDGCDDDINGT